MVAFKCVFRYLNGTKDWHQHFGGALWGEGEGTLQCYVNSDNAGCPDDYKLTTGLDITLGGAVNGRSRKHTSTAQSITDAEYYAFCSRRHETHRNLASLEEALNPDYPSHVLRFTLTDCENQEQNLPQNCTCTHCDKIPSSCSHGYRWRDRLELRTNCWDACRLLHKAAAEARLLEAVCYNGNDWKR